MTQKPGLVSPPILTTKLYPPPTRSASTIVPRLRLIERLNEGMARAPGLTLISAPAGFGKTTLVSDWLRQKDEGRGRKDEKSEIHPSAFILHSSRVAWLSLDDSDNDFTRFLTYFIAALQQLDPSVGQTAQGLLQSPQPPPVETVMTTLVNDIYSVFANARCLLVLDDYHHIDTKAIDEALTFLLDHLPPPPGGLQLVIATRDDPHLPLARLRVQSRLTELRATDLRFTAAEAADFLNRVMGLNLSAEDVAALETRTEGWIAGLQLAALSMQKYEDVSHFVQSFTGSHRFILDYLTEEILEQQPESIQQFLLRTAVLNRLTASLCNALTGRDSGQATLEMLEQANLFIVPLDEERRWYRYHHLFADLLRQRLRQHQPEQVPNLHHRASEWYKQNGFAHEAIRHALRAQDFERAATLVEAYANDLLQRSEHTTVSNWIKALPVSLVRARPYLSVHHAWALQLMGQFEAAEVCLTNAEEALADPDQDNKSEGKTIRGYIHSHRAYLTFIRGEHAKTITYARQALEQLPPEATVIRTQTALYLGVAYRFQGEFQAALNVFTETVTASQKLGGSVTAVLSFLNLAELYTEQAQLHQARNIYEQALQFTERHTGRPDRPFTGYVYVGIGRILRQWNELEEAYQHTTKGVALCRDRNTAELLALSCIELAHIHHALGNDEQARAALQEAKQIFDGFSPWGSDRVAAHQAHLALMRGEVKSAERWAQASDLNLEGELELHRELEYLILARVLIAQGRVEEALSLLERLHQTAQVIGKTQSVLESLMLQAMALFAQGQTEQALIKLEQALAIGEPENYVRLFVDEGQPMAHLLREAISRGIAPGYAGKTLAVFPNADALSPVQTPAAERVPSSSIHPPHSELVEPLSERELEVLQLLADGLTNREIAARLFVTVNTVKAHNHNIYGKLGVNSRTKAVAQARYLGILPSI